MPKFRIKLKYWLYGLVFLALCFIVWQIVGLSYGQPKIAALNAEKFVDYGTLKVVVPEGKLNLETLNPFDQAIAVNSFESLVKLNADFQIESSLAVAWGLLDDLTWEFTLRKNVKFHDGKILKADDVVRQLTSLRENELSELNKFLDSIEGIEVLDDNTLIIKTVFPDPLLLKKLAKIFIFREENDRFLGTGPYLLTVGENKFFYQRYADYWKGVPKFESVEVVVEADKSRRVLEVLENGAEFISYLPFEAEEILREENFQIEHLPSLEVQFLLFNFDGVLGDLNARKYLKSVLNFEEFRGVIGSFTRASTQFVSKGIFGFNNRIGHQVFSEEVFLKGETLQIHFPVGFDVLGEYLRETLKDKGVFAVISYLDGEKLLSSMKNRDADIYFLGFKSDFADSAEFFQAIVVSGAEFNLSNYENLRLDSMISEVVQSMDEVKRGDLLREAMKIVVEDDVIGVPMFEYEKLYAFSQRFLYVPRLDGILYFDDLILQ